MNQKTKYFFTIVGLTTAYFVAGKLGLSLASINPSVTAVWAPTGIAKASIILLGGRIWPAIFVGAFLVNLTTDGTVVTSLGIAAGNTLEGLLAAYLINRFAGGRHAFRSVENVFRFVFLAGLLAPIVSATLGVITLCIGGFASWQDFSDIWSTWWLGDMGGALIIAPLIITWFGNFPRLRKDKMVEAILLLISLGVVGSLLFGGWSNISTQHYQVGFLTIPLIIWVALRFTPRESTSFVFLLSVIAILGTWHGFGPYVIDFRNQSLLLTQAFLAVVSVSALILSAAVLERQFAQKEALSTKEQLALLTKGKEMGEALAEAQATAHLGSWEWNLKSGEVTWSDEMYRIYGYKPKEFPVNFEKANERVVPDDRIRIQKNLEKDLDEFTPPQRATPSIEYRIVLSSGEERVLHGEGIIYANSAGQPIKMTGTVQDVTDSKKVAESLEKTNRANLNILEDLETAKATLEKQTQDLRKFQMAVADSSDQIVIANIDGIVVYANHATEEITGYSAKEIVGTKAGALWSGYRDRNYYQNLLRTIKVDKKSLKSQITNKRKNGEEYTSEIHVSPVTDSTGNPVYFVAIERDITKEREVDRAKSEFISLASHQLRTPLGIIKWYLEALSGQPVYKTMPKEARSYFDEVYKSNERVLNLVRSLLSVSRIDQGRVKNEPQETDIVLIVKDVVREMNIAAQKKKIKLDLIMKDINLPAVFIDPLRFHEVVENLVANSIEYTPAGGSVGLTISKVGDKVSLSVADTGIGISAADQKKLFTKFFRSEKATTHNPEGSGLGLYVVKSYTEAWGGKLTVESQEGKGSIFTVTLPLELKNDVAVGGSQ